MKIFRNDAGVPRTAGSGDHAGDQIGENAGKNQVPPAIPGMETENLRNFLEVRGNGHGAGDYVEQNVPLRA